MIQFFNNFLKYKYLMGQLVKKNIKLRYRRSFLGMLWTLIEPLLTMIVLSVVFGSLLGRNSTDAAFAGVPFPIYVLTGRLLYSVFSSATNSAMLGYSKEFLEERYDEIVEFSELGSFIDVPVKNYSSGMRARLGFSVATIVEPDILILDEVLSVGDAKFRKKCENRIQSMFDKGVTVIFVSHSTSQVLRMCNKGILLEQGRLIAQGDVEDVVSVYEAKMSENE